MKGPVEFKGKLNGLYMVVEENADFGLVMSFLRQVLQKKGDFYKGTRIIGLNGATLSYKEKAEVESLIHEFGLHVESLEIYDDHKPKLSPSKPNIVVISENDETIQNSNQTPVEENKSKIAVKALDKSTDEGASDESVVSKTIASDSDDTKFIYGTLRSGQGVEHNGNVIIIGDVNPGAKIVAAGNVVVMGRLLGFVHAGASGNERAIVVANVLKPTQIRIAKFISVPPNDDVIASDINVEKAYVHEGLIKIEKCH